MRKWVGPTRGCSMCELVIQIVLYVPKTMCIYVCMHAWACYAQMHERTCACINMKIRIVNYLYMYMYFFYILSFYWYHIYIYFLILHQLLICIYIWVLIYMRWCMSAYVHAFMNIYVSSVWLLLHEYISILSFYSFPTYCNTNYLYTLSYICDDSFHINDYLFIQFTEYLLKFHLFHTMIYVLSYCIYCTYIARASDRHSFSNKS